MSAAQVWLITGATRGIGAEFVRQVCVPAQSRRHNSSHDAIRIRHPVDNMLQVLAKDNTVVLAGARSPDKSDSLKSLQRQYSERLQILSLDVACTSSIQVLNDSSSEGTACSVGMLCKALCTIPRQQPRTLQSSIFSRALTTWSTTLVSPVQDKIVLSKIPLLASGCFN